MDTRLLETYNNLYNQTERKLMTASMIKAFRETHGLQKKEVAELIDIKPQTYGAYESGRNETPIEVLVRLSMLYNVPVDVLVQRDNMSRTDKTAKEQLELYDEQIKELREAMLKGDSEATEQFSKLIEGLQALTDAIKENKFGTDNN